MPCMGPEYCKKTADKAFEHVLKYLREEHNIFKFEPEKRWFEDRENAKNRLKEAIHKVFELDSWEGF